MTSTPAQIQARLANGRQAGQRQRARFAANKQKGIPSRPFIPTEEAKPRTIPRYLCAMDEFRLPGLCRIYGPDGRLREIRDPFTRQRIGG